MKGIILAGGTGSRLHPCTKITNKHLLPVYNKPMIYYPLLTLKNAGIKDILIISGIEHAGDFLKLLGSGKEFGVRLTYEIQDEPMGIAQALSLAEDFADNDKVTVILGDNIFESDIKEHLDSFVSGPNHAKVFLKETTDAKRFGVASVNNGVIDHIEEKPKHPTSNLAVTGLYMYDSSVFGIIKTLKPSARGEYEITDVNNTYINTKKMAHAILDGFWSDAGTFESLFRASELIRKIDKKTEKKT